MMVSSSTEMACVGSSHVLNVCSGSSCRARSRIRVQTSVAESIHYLKHVEKPGRRGGEGIGAMWKKQTPSTAGHSTARPKQPHYSSAQHVDGLCLLTYVQRLAKLRDLVLDLNRSMSSE